ncbi:caprin homolog [Phlebotomus argentipes]|uniref:caprin homolog n=1 Tax=Phlebotomus argentipes TaxID=94469 RepID=UPI0028935A28|nr:caprin homolog [Phlebotomus argentipes]
MPSCAKIEKRASAEVQLVDNGAPIRQVIVAVEHKIRNLEKRKGKLESYRDLQKSGKDLTTDQKIAVSKYDEVTQCLDFARELFKQVHAISAMWDKDQKKVARKETANRIQNEVTKVKEVLIIQDTLENLRDEQAREDFLTGSNGAAKLEKKELDLLDKLYDNSTVKRVPGSNLESYLACAQKAADHLISTVDGKPKSFCDTNYERVRNILQVVQNSGYFDKQFAGTDKDKPGVDEVVKNGVESPTAVVEEEEPPKVEEKPMTQPAQPLPPAALPQTAAPLVPQMLMPQPITTIIPASVMSTVTPPLVGMASPLMNAEHMRAMEQNYFKHQKQYMQQMRPISDIIGGSTYFFLQDSELDSPDVITSVAPPVTVPPAHMQPPAVPIATQTFTNQNFPMVAPQNVYPGMKPPTVVNAPLTANPPPPEHLAAAVHIPGFAATRPLPPANAGSQPVQPVPAGGAISPAHGQQGQQFAAENRSVMIQPPSQPVMPSVAQPEKPAPPSRQEEPAAAVEEQQLTISEWKPEESAAVTKKAPPEESTDWAEQVVEPSKEWNPADSAGGDNQFGGSWQAEGSQSGGYNSRRGYATGHPRRRGVHNMGYRSGRPSGNGGGFHQNGGGANRSGGGSGGGTFYRNNDPNYYQNQNGGGGFHNGGGNGGSTFKGRSARSSMGPRGERSHSNRRDNRPSRPAGGYQGPTRSATAAAQND